MSARDGAGALGCRAACAAVRPVARAVGLAAGCPVVTSVRTAAPLVALTVDDGPHPSTTPGLLAVLAAHRVRATFFLIGERVRAHRDLVARIAAGGHEVANHLMRDEASALLPPAAFARDLAAVHDLLAPHGPVSFFRPGSGWFTPAMLRTAAVHGYRCALGSPMLLSDGRGPGATGRRLAGRAHPGAVAVLHEGDDRRVPVVDVADALLHGLHGRGLRATTLRELTDARGAAGKAFRSSGGG